MKTIPWYALIWLFVVLLEAFLSFINIRFSNHLGLATTSVIGIFALTMFVVHLRRMT